jgi:hypothetical protein
VGVAVELTTYDLSESGGVSVSPSQPLGGAR